VADLFFQYTMNPSVKQQTAEAPAVARRKEDQPIETEGRVVTGGKIVH
jgi:hypothetical protein